MRTPPAPTETRPPEIGVDPHDKTAFAPPAAPRRATPSDGPAAP